MEEMTAYEQTVLWAGGFALTVLVTFLLSTWSERVASQEPGAEPPGHAAGRSKGKGVFYCVLLAGSVALAYFLLYPQWRYEVAAVEASAPATELDAWRQGLMGPEIAEERIALWEIRDYGAVEWSLANAAWIGGVGAVWLVVLLFSWHAAPSPPRRLESEPDPEWL
jgi:hypothetical protein